MPVGVNGSSDQWKGSGGGNNGQQNPIPANSNKSGTSTSTDPNKTSTALTVNQTTIMQLIDCFQTPPVNVSQDYMNECIAAAAFLRNPVAQGSSANTDLSSVALAARNNVFAVENDIDSYISSVAPEGTSNPFYTISQYNANRVGFATVTVSSDEADTLVEELEQLVAQVDTYNAKVAAAAAAENASKQTGTTSATSGKSASSTTLQAGQLSSVNTGLQGFGGVGNTTPELLSFVPDLTQVAQQKAQEQLAALDFTKQVPKILFTADYVTDATGNKGCVVGWRIMPNASGYMLTRRNIFDQSTQTITLSNQDCQTRMALLSDWVQSWCLSFYDDVQVTQVYAFLDTNIDPNAYYVYTLQAYQVRDTGADQIFSVPSAKAASLPSAAQIVDGVNPWPVLAQFLLGDSQYDWVLAAFNIQASTQRNDNTSDTQKYGYLNAVGSYLLSQGGLGKLVLPSGNGLATIVSNITDAISKFGVNQVITELFTASGIINYFDQLPLPTNSIFNQVNKPSVISSEILAAVLSSVDPESATLTLQTLVTNVYPVIAGSNAQPDLVLNNSQPQEISLPGANATNPDAPFFTALNFYGTSYSDDSTIDLTTYDGLSTLIRSISVLKYLGGTPSNTSNGSTVIASLGGSNFNPGTVTVANGQAQATSNPQNVNIPPNAGANIDVSINSNVTSNITINSGSGGS